FDASVWEFFAPLAIGAPVVLARPGGEKDTEYLAHAIREQGITILQMVPSALRVLLQEPSMAACESLRYVVSGGEALDWELAGEFGRCLPRARLGNMYGPSEASDDTTSVDVAEVRPGPGPVPIGRPVANARVYVLDAWRRPVPIGVPGELYIGGAGLARGYLNRPELTHERFVDDPFTPGERLYRTGDLVRWRPDGLLGFIGRTDHQVKIRGFRIELGEIENALKACTGVRNGAVVVHEDRPGNRRLVAYVEGRQPDLAGLRTELGAHLPDYMVPQHFVVLSALPLLPNGKLDRKALPAPETGLACAGFVAPRSPLEQTLADIWADVLGCARVGVHDNFFDLGGHSLSATQAMARLRSVMGVALPLRTLFEAPTVAELTTRVHAALGDPTTDRQPPLVAGSGSRDGHAPASSAQQALWTIDRLHGPSGLYNIPLAIRLVGELDTRALAQALQAFVDRHPALRTCFEQDDGVPVQRVAPHVETELPVVDVCARARPPATALPEDANESAGDGTLDPALDAEIDRLAEAPFDLAHGPLLRARLLRISTTDHVFVFVVHHIVADGWSIGLLARELPLLYRRARCGEPPALPPPAQFDFRDYAVWQQQWLASDAARASLGWWRQQLAGLEPLELPTDFPRPRDGLLRGDALELVVPAERLAALKALARSTRATLHMVLLAAFETLLMRYSGQHDFALGTPVAGRDHAEIESVFGMFVNMLVMRADLSGDPGFASLVERVRQTALAAYSHQDIPFDRIVADINPAREANRNPLFQVSFSVDNTPPAPFELPGIAARRVAGHSEIAKFDLSLTFVETGAELHGTLEYSTDLFERATIERMAAHLGNL
ncbi:MAG: AMP-binding protein, partial [Burkholderiaceae bacterium]|nr:AMP-binding protein [Burkholderiaceae bacterium]